MMLSINNPVQSTYIFIYIFLFVLIFSYKGSNEKGLSFVRTQELKGFAILAVLFSHIGFFLVSQHEFLFPLSALAGVGLNLFLFLSAYGLTLSYMKKEETRLQFYVRRLSKLLIPFWLVLIAFVLLDYFALGISYSTQFLTHAFFGIFTQADIYTDLNSPFWYMTLILFYYILFPIVFFKKYPWISAGIIYFGTYFFIVEHSLEFFKDVALLYKTHLLAFPLGIICAWFFSYSTLFKKIQDIQIFKKIKDAPVHLKNPFRYGSICLLLAALSYFTIHSGVGEGLKIEQKISLLTMFIILGIFILKKNEYRLLTILGIYSYEIYLIHWPLMYRYDFLYAHVPAWMATTLYIVLFLILGKIIKIISQKVNSILHV